MAVGPKQLGSDKLRARTTPRVFAERIWRVEVSRDLEVFGYRGVEHAADPKHGGKPFPEPKNGKQMHGPRLF